MSKKKKNKKAGKSKRAAKPAADATTTAEPSSSVSGSKDVDVEGEPDEPDESEALSSPEPSLPLKAPAAHAEHGHHVPDRKGYWRIFGMLAALTALEVGIAYLDQVISKTALVTALVGLALTKAGLVAYFFMHLKQETKEMKWTVLIPTIFPTLYAFVLIAEGMYRSMWGGS